MKFERKDYHHNNINVYTLAYEDFDPSIYIDHLTTIEKERYFTFKHLQRKQEFVATRLLRHEVIGFEHIHYDEVGAPYINREGYISISHTKNLVGFAFSKDFKVGLDLEKIQDKITTIKHKFISEKEKLIFDTSSSTELTKIWSSKETLYKLSGQKGLNFRTQLEIDKKEEHWIGEIITLEKKESACLKIINTDNTIITFNITACE